MSGKSFSLSIFTICMYVFCSVAIAGPGVGLSWDKESGVITDTTGQYEYLHFDSVNLIVSVNNKRLTLPACITEHLDLRDGHDFSFEVNRPTKRLSEKRFSLSFYPHSSRNFLTLSLYPDTLKPASYTLSIKQSNRFARIAIPIDKACLQTVRQNITKRNLQ